MATRDPTESAARVATEPGALTNALLTASRVLIALSVRTITAIDDPITLPQFRMLVVLSTNGPLKLSTLAKHLNVKPSTATRMIDRLLHADLVSRHTNPHSRREVLIALTDNGTQVVTTVTEQRRTEIARIVARMPHQHRTELVRALEAFNDASGEPPITETSPAWQ
ncbi:MAG TPA: MarR family transcriptional regulator [Pseudonocardiaceae bacterium]|nr:MarR family transcriptional regulator [Pseudonocardiaceae bacterium]